MAFMFIVFLFPTNPQTDAPDMNYTVVVFGGILLLSLAWYYCPVYGGVHWFTGPIPNVEKNTVEKDSESEVDEKKSSEVKVGASSIDHD